MEILMAILLVLLFPGVVLSNLVIFAIASISELGHKALDKID